MDENLDLLQQKQYERMTKTPVGKLLLKLSAPTIISMMVTSVYNMADTYFVSQLGTSAAGAVGIVFSLMAIIQAVGFTLGMGSGSINSRLLGQKEYEKANETGSTAFFTALFFGILLSVFGLVFIDDLMILLGSTKTILPFAKDYAVYILLGAPMMCASFVMNNLLRCQGKAVLSMIGLGCGGIINIFLDPIFIYVFKLGIKGAAIATLISQAISFLILLFMYISKRSIISINIKNVSKKFSVYINIIKTGLPSFCRQGLASISTVALNVNAAVYGDAAVAAMSIVGRVFMFIVSVMIGFGQGYQPVVGYNYGAGEFKRVKKAFNFSFKIGFIVLTSLGIAGFIFAPQIIGAFRADDAEVIKIGALAFRAQCVALPLQPMIVLCNMTFQVLGMSWQATFLSSARQGIFFVPLIMILPLFFGIFGIQITQCIADVLTFLFSVIFFISFMKKLNYKISASEKSL